MLAFKNKRTKETSDLRKGHYSEGVKGLCEFSHTRDELGLLSGGGGSGRMDGWICI